MCQWVKKGVSVGDKSAMSDRGNVTVSRVNVTWLLHHMTQLAVLCRLCVSAVLQSPREYSLSSFLLTVHSFKYATRPSLSIQGGPAKVRPTYVFDGNL